MGTTTMNQSGPGSSGNGRGTPHFLKLQDWSLTMRWFSAISRKFVWRRGSSSTAEMQSVYSTAPADWTVCILNYYIKKIP